MSSVPGQRVSEAIVNLKLLDSVLRRSMTERKSVLLSRSWGFYLTLYVVDGKQTTTRTTSRYDSESR